MMDRKINIARCCRCNGKIVRENGMKRFLQKSLLDTRQRERESALCKTITQHR